MNRSVIQLTPIAVAVAIAGCGDNLADEARQAKGSVLLTCNGTQVTKDYVPDKFALRASTYSDTNWYRNYFEGHIGPEGFLEYADIPGYFEGPPEKLSDRPIANNTLPYDTYAISYFYIDGDDDLQPMKMYFGGFPEPITHNSSGGVLHFPYSVYLTAPEEARYIVMRVHDSYWGWQYKNTSGDWMEGMDEVWYARPADSRLRVDGVSNVEDQPVGSWNTSELGDCRLDHAWQDNRDDLYGGSDDQVLMRSDLREIERRTVERKERSGSDLPLQSAPKNAPGMTQASNPKGEDFGFPLVGFSREEALKTISSGGIDSGWKDGKWHSPAL